MEESIVEKIRKEMKARRKAERKAKAEQIDNLLDIANWNRRKLAETGDESYGDRLFAVEAELKKIVEDEQ